MFVYWTEWGGLCISESIIKPKRRKEKKEEKPKENEEKHEWIMYTVGWIIEWIN